MFTKLISDPSLPSGAFVLTPPSEAGSTAVAAAPELATRRSQIERLVQQIELPNVRAIVGNVFQDLLRLLECLNLIEAHLRQVNEAEETFALFQLIHDEARVLIEFIRTDALECDSMTEDLADTLDGITFAVNHDLQRVFETNPLAANSNQTAHVVVGKLYRAHDVLTNCLQQSTITLAMVFDPEIVAARLFNNSDMRYRQSLQLCEDLSALLQLVENCEKEKAEPSLSPLTAGIERFRNESMECLMYSDWPQFESFCERIELSPTNLPELESVLHQFRCYLETLLGQVRMRAVLADVFPIQFGAADNCQLPASTFENCSPLAASFESQNEGAAWNTFAFAV